MTKFKVGSEHYFGKNKFIEIFLIFDGLIHPQHHYPSGIGCGTKKSSP